MTEQSHATLLRRMARSRDTAGVESPLTSSRAVRLALTKAANDTAGLAVTVSGIAEEVTSLDDALGSLSDQLMLVELWRDGDLTGALAIDMQLRSAVLEMQTIGALIGTVAEDRPATRADKVLCDPLINAFIAAFPAAVMGTPFQGWGDNLVLGDQFENTRAAGLVLRDRDYRIVRMSVDIGIADRQGLLVIVLPLAAMPHVPEPVSKPVVDWHAEFEKTVLEAPASMEALLHRFSIPLATANALEVGTLLPLTGCSVNSVRLLSPDGQVVAQAKLGQTGGKRAVRLEAAPLPELQELPENAGRAAIRPALPEISAADDAMPFATAQEEEAMTGPLTDDGLGAAPIMDMKGNASALNDA